MELPTQKSKPAWSGARKKYAEYNRVIESVISGQSDGANVCDDTGDGGCTPRNVSPTTNVISSFLSTFVTLRQPLVDHETRRSKGLLPEQIPT